MNEIYANEGKEDVVVILTAALVLQKNVMISHILLYMAAEVPKHEGDHGSVFAYTHTAHSNRYVIQSWTEWSNRIDKGPYAIPPMSLKLIPLESIPTS